MRFLLKVIMDVEAGNRLAKAGKLGTTIQSILTDLKPEAAYFTDTEWSKVGISFPRNAGCLTDPRDCRAMVPGIECED